MERWLLQPDQSHLVSCPRTLSLNRWGEKLMRCLVKTGQQVKVVVEIGRTVWQAEDEPLTQEAGLGEVRYRE